MFIRISENESVSLSAIVSAKIITRIENNDTELNSFEVSKGIGYYEIIVHKRYGDIAIFLTLNNEVKWIEPEFVTDNVLKQLNLYN